MGQNAPAVLEWKLATGKGNLEVLLKVAGRSFQETNHQVLTENVCEKTSVIVAPKSLIGIDALVIILF